LQAAGLRAGCIGLQSVLSGRGMQAVHWLLVLCVAAAESARILTVLPTNTKSHYAMYGRLIDALAKRDHHLTVISHFTMGKGEGDAFRIHVALVLNNLML
ncbi:jg18169, partial [Pararge aegeria aegeria]